MSFHHRNEDGRKDGNRRHRLFMAGSLKAQLLSFNTLKGRAPMPHGGEKQDHQNGNHAHQIYFLLSGHFVC